MTVPIKLMTVPDPCLFGPCDPNADCEREGLLSENFMCSCQTPFTIGDGFNCSSMCKLLHKLVSYTTSVYFISSRSLS